MDPTSYYIIDVLANSEDDAMPKFDSSYAEVEVEGDLETEFSRKQPMTSDTVRVARHGQKSLKVKRVDSGERYTCQTCDETFKYPWVLKHHIRLHTGERPYVCSYCGLSFISKRECNDHTRIHTGEKPFVCNQCPQAFRKSAQLRRHKWTHNGSPYTCVPCELQFCSNISLEDHLHSELHSKLAGTDDNPYQCNFCSQTYRSMSGVRVHAAAHHADQIVPMEGTFKCIVCQAGFADRSWLRYHQQTEKHKPLTISKHVSTAGKKEYVCINCNLSFTQLVGLKAHKKSKAHYISVYKQRDGEIPNTWLIPVACKLCDKQFDDRVMYIEHTDAEHSKIFQFFCELCLEYFPKRDEYRTHNTNVHADVYKHRCPQCGLANKTMMEFKRHMWSHRKEGDGIKKHLCFHCGKVFRVESILVRHMLQCSGALSLKCDVCGRIFNAERNLQYHMLTHTTEHPFKCSMCDLTFKRKLYMARHEKEVHKFMVGSPNICSECQCPFKNKRSLSRHQLICHSHSMELECTICKCFLPNMSALITHISDHDCSLVYPCGICLSFFTSSVDLQQHESGHTVEECSAFSCNRCCQVFNQHRLLNNHKNLHDQFDKFEPIECDETVNEHHTFDHLESSQDGIVLVEIDEENGLLNTGLNKMQGNCSSEPLCIQLDEIPGQDIGVSVIKKERESMGRQDVDNCCVHQCDICQALMVNEKLVIDTHQNLHLNPMPHQCPVCHTQFLWAVVLQKHLSASNSKCKKELNRQRLKTRKCRRQHQMVALNKKRKLQTENVSNSATDFLKETNVVIKEEPNDHESNDLTVDLNFILGLPLNMNSEAPVLSSVSEMKMHNCRKCQKQFESSQDLLTHFATHSGHYVEKNQGLQKENLADVCVKDIQDGTRLRQPSKRKFESLESALQKDVKSSNRIRKLKKRLPKLKLECKICAATFRNMQALQSHIKTCLPVGMKVCGMCDNVMLDSEILVHKLQHFKGRKAVQCGKCSQPFKLKSQVDDCILMLSKELQLLNELKSLLERNEKKSVVCKSTQTE